MLFLGLDPDGDNAIPQAVTRIWTRALERLLPVAGGAWSLCELGGDETDFEWLCAWARSLTSAQAQRWMDKHHLFHVDIGDKSPSSFQTIGLLLLLFCSECARREGREGTVWPSVRRDAAGGLRFPSAHEKLWSANEIQGERLLLALREAAYFWGVRHCFRGENEQEYIGTIRLQFGFTLDGAKRLPEWLCGYGWPAPVRDLVRDRRNASPSFGRLWSSLHALRDGNLTRAAWKAAHADSSWILPGWADALAEYALARRELRAIENTRVGVQNEAASLALAAIWDAQNSLDSAEFLSEPRLSFDGEAPFFRAEALDFAASPDAPWFSPEVVSLSLYIGQTRVGQWLRASQKGRLFCSAQSEWVLPVVAPSLTAHLVANDQTCVAKQTLVLWEERDGLALWNRASGKRLDVWSHAPKAGGDYVLLVDGDLEVAPLPAKWRKMGERRLLFPDVSWWKEARVLDNGALFWSAASREEPDWTRDFRVEVDLYGVSDLRLGRAFAVRVQLSQGVTVEALRWGGRTLEQKAPDVFEVPPLSPQNAVSVLPLEADLRDAQGNAATVQRRVPLPLCAAMWRASREDPWTIAGRGDLWNSTQGREWRLWGAWDAGARLCEGSVPFDVVPTRSHTLRPPQAWGAPISVREAPYGAENTRLVLCGSAREGGALAGVKRTAVSQVDVEMRHEIEPSEGHQVLVWGKGGAFSAAWGGAVLQVGTRWMVPFSFQNAQAPVLAVGLAYEGTWLGAWFARDWRELRPVKWDGERAARFALWARWMRLPWREHAATFHELSREWPTDTLLSWLDPAPENRHDLRMGAPASDLIRAVFRGHFQGDHLAAKELVALWKAPPLQLLGALAETDPFLMVAFARKWAKNFAPGAFAALLKNGAKKLDAPSDNPTEGATIALAAWRHMQTLALHLYEHQSISDEGDRELRIGLNDPALRRRVAALLLQTLADDLIT